MAGEGGVNQYCGKCYHSGPDCPTHGKNDIREMDMTLGPKTDTSMKMITEMPPPQPDSASSFR